MDKKTYKVPITHVVRCPDCDETGWLCGKHINWDRGDNFIGLPPRCETCGGRGELTDEELKEIRKKQEEEFERDFPWRKEIEEHVKQIMIREFPELAEEFDGR